MGIAYSAGLVMIYLLVVAQFRSYTVPLIIMAPIPLTLIGIMPGHAVMGQQFTAPSMIGMIALAGIIVRNSILLVDFIQQEVAAGKPLQEATISAADCTNGSCSNDGWILYRRRSDFWRACGVADFWFVCVNGADTAGNSGGVLRISMEENGVNMCATRDDAANKKASI
jgi:hypothetical protein